ERMQGQEREMILCSLTASDPLFILNLRNFLYQPQRLNVTATRARSKFILIASRAFLATDCIDSSFDEQKALLQSLKDRSTVFSWNSASGAVQADETNPPREEIAWPE